MKITTTLRAIVALGFYMALSASANAQIAKIGLDISWHSDYVTPNGVAYDDSIVRADLSASFKHDIKAGLTGITSFGGDSPYSEEWQVYLEKRWAVCSNVAVTTGARYEGIDGDWDLLIPYGLFEVTKEINASNVIVGYTRAEYWYNPQETTTDNGLITTIGLRYLHMFSDKFSIRMGVSAVHDDGLQGGGAGWVGVGEAYLDYRVSSQSTAYLGGKYYTPMGISNPVDVRRVQKVFEVGVKIDDFPGQIGSLYNRITGEFTGGKAP
jgi:hypothetical protein